MVNSAPSVELGSIRRHRDPPHFWVSLVIVSVLFHTLGFMALRWWMAQPTPSPNPNAPIAVEFIGPDEPLSNSPKSQSSPVIAALPPTTMTAPEGEVTLPIESATSSEISPAVERSAIVPLPASPPPSPSPLSSPSPPMSPLGGDRSSPAGQIPSSPPTGQIPSPTNSPQIVPVGSPTPAPSQPVASGVMLPSVPGLSTAMDTTTQPTTPTLPMPSGGLTTLPPAGRSGLRLAIAELTPINTEAQETADSEPQALETSRSFPEQVYPSSVRGNLGTVVKLRALVNQVGKPEQVQILQGSAAPEYDDLAQKLVMRLSFKPATQAGQPAASEVELTVQLEAL